MIDTFVTAILTRKNGKQNKIVYKKPRKLTEENIVKICSRFKIQAPTWNEYSKQFEFDDSFYFGNPNFSPESLDLLDVDGWAIETVSDYQE